MSSAAKTNVFILLVAASALLTIKLGLLSNLSEIHNITAVNTYFTFAVLVVIWSFTM